MTTDPTTDPAADRTTLTSDQVRERALTRARAERGLPPRVPADELAEYALDLGRRNSEHRTANRDRLGAHNARQVDNGRRIARARSLACIAAEFGDYANAEVEEHAVAAWLLGTLRGETDSWLVLLGPTGVGKTWQAVAAYRRLVDGLGCEGVAIRVPELLGRSLPSDPDRVDIRHLEEVPLLLLDDMPGNLSEWDHRTLYRIIDARVANRRRTLITMNLRRDEVRGALGDRLASRLSANTRLVAMTGPDRRITRAD